MKVMDRNAQAAPNRDQIESVFEYRDGGLFRRSNGKRGYLRPDGYVYVRLLGNSYPEHRLIHLLFSGEWPYQVDHKNGIRSDNRPDNLRGASHSQNCMNRSPARAWSKGCYWQKNRGKWIAQIGFNGKRKTIGYFETEAEAAKAYSEMSRSLHGDFSRVS